MTAQPTPTSGGKVAITPGTWQAKNEVEWEVIVGNIDGPDNGEMSYTTIAEVWSDDAEGRANARLIMGAPELLWALRRVLPIVEHAYHTSPDEDGFLWAGVVACRTAIERATGEVL